MAFLADLFRRVINFRQKPKTDIEQRVARLLQPYVKSLRDIIMWKNTNVTIAFMLLANLLLWVIRILTIRPLGLIAGTLLLLVILDGTATALGAGRRPCRERMSSRGNGGEQLVRITVRARQWLSGAYADMLVLRRQNPSKFCFATCCGLCILWFIAYVGGVILAHALLNAAFLAPFIPKLQSTIDSIQSHGDSDGEVEEFLPELSSKAIEELNRAGEINVSLGLVDLSLPSDASILYAAAEGESSDEDDFLETKKDGNLLLSPASIQLTDSSDSENDFIPKEGLNSMSTKEMPYEPSHFVTDAPVKRQDVNIPSATIADGWVPFLMNAASYFTYTKQTPVAQKSQDSDSDEFELIDKSDL